MTEEMKRCAPNLFWNVVLPVGVYTMTLASSYDNTSWAQTRYALQANFSAATLLTLTLMLLVIFVFKSDISQTVDQPFGHLSI
jgi:ACR3 family arsenite efflux pump ArsB